MAPALSVTEALAMVEELPAIDVVGLEERAASLTTGVVGPDAEFSLELAIRCTDLTSLEADDTPEKISRLCATAIRPDQEDPSIPSVAAVCVYPPLVPTAVRSLKGTSVQVAAVAGGFPSGDVPTATKLREIREVLDMGADEVDMTLNRGVFLAGGDRETYEEVAASKDLCGDSGLKVILETGQLGSYEQIRRASAVVMVAGADFIKTSTGKITPGATFPAALCIMETIRQLREEIGRGVGIKVSGGIRTADDAGRHLLMLSAVLGSEWLGPDLFRIGASSLLEDLVTHVRRERGSTQPPRADGGGC
jgi:deoxyribose-phosphate aldolase